MFWTFLWLFNVKMTYRTNFYKNRPNISMFSKKRRIWRHLQKWWGHYAVKNVEIDPILLRQVIFAVRNNCDDFWRILSAGTLFLHIRHCCILEHRWHRVDPTHVILFYSTSKYPIYIVLMDVFWNENEHQRVGYFFIKMYVHGWVFHQNWLKRAK